MTEAELLAAVRELCDRHGILCFHVYDSRKTAGTGYPDCTLVGQSLMWAELKSATGNPRTEQLIWKYRIIAAGGRWELWRPADLESGHIERVLSLL